jgi:peptide-methionine (S)-S-oxide reductase
VDIRYDPSKLSYRQLLEVFFLVAHDPTSRDRQGPDAGPEYRAIVFATDSTQRREAEAYLAELTSQHRFARPIVTEIQPFREYRVAEEFHQDFAKKHPSDPYIVTNDLPKLAKLKRQFPSLYLATPSS